MAAKGCPGTLDEEPWTFYFGYKLSVSVDRRHKLIRRVKVSDANVADTLHLVEVLDRDNSNRVFWADRGYHDRSREHWLKQIGWRAPIQRKGQAGKPIGARAEACNRRIASPRARVEHIFASLARMGGKMVRSIGRTHAEFGLTIRSTVHNLKRLTSLLEMPGTGSMIGVPWPALPRDRQI